MATQVLEKDSNVGLSQGRNPLSIAPMMDRTDRHYRYFMRQISRHVLLYTEMVVSQAIIHGDRDYLLGFHPDEKPLVLQVGGDDPKQLAQCARIAADFDYDEINLNVGCPSDRVQSGNFGACLMLQPERVAECVAAMQAASPLPVSVKHRIGVDEQDHYDDLVKFVETVAQTGCDRFTVHARKAWLQGLSPKENRDIPPLRYEDVYRLKQDFPQQSIEINGGILTLPDIHKHLNQVDAVMIGRAAYDNPYLFATVDRSIYGGDRPTPTRQEVAEAMLPYIEHWLSRPPTGRVFKLNRITRHMLQLFTGQRGSRQWRRIITERSCKPSASIEVIKEALEAVSTQANQGC
ncbi:MAG: tRNA dihydrouridine(20/20a) synthase DusA [Cyanobacteria bacterium P01_D01_bin.73]